MQHFHAVIAKKSSQQQHQKEEVEKGEKKKLTKFTWAQKQKRKLWQWSCKLLIHRIIIPWVHHEHTHTHWERERETERLVYYSHLLEMFLLWHLLMHSLRYSPLTVKPMSWESLPPLHSSLPPLTDHNRAAPPLFPTRLTCWLYCIYNVFIA